MGSARLPRTRNWQRTSQAQRHRLDAAARWHCETWRTSCCGPSLRGCGPQAEELEERHRRDGFEVASADKIFESTTLAQ
jgi:hypothetical protein